MKTAEQEIVIRLHCIDLPGRTFDGRGNIRVGMQKGRAVVDDVAGDAAEVTFECTLRVRRNPKTGAPNFLGHYAHGKPAERFLYLCWGERLAGQWHGFRRAKVHLRDLDWQAVQAAIGAKRPIEAVVRLTDSKGGPICASIKGSHIRLQV